MSEYERFFTDQIGSGGGCGNCDNYVTIGRKRYQQGAGIGSYLKGLYRRALPMLKRGAKAVGKEAIRTGANILDDIANEGQPLKDSLRKRVRESGSNLKRKAEKAMDKMMMMEGSGYKKKRKSQNPHSTAAPGAVSISKQKKKKKKIKLSNSNSSSSRSGGGNIKPRSKRDIFES